MSGRSPSGKELRIKAGLGVISPPETREQLGRIISSMQTKIEAAIQEADSTAYAITNPNDAYKLACALSSLTKVAIEADKWRAEAGGYLEDAVKILQESMKREFNSKPELLEQVHKHLDEVYSEEMESRGLLLESGEDVDE